MHKTWQVCPDTRRVGVAQGWRQGPCLCSCEDCCWQGKRGLLEPKKFQIKAVKGFLNPSCSPPALHQHSLMLCFKQKLSLWSNYYAREEAASMRRLQKVLPNQLSVRHYGRTLSGLAVTVTRCVLPISSTSLPGSLPLHQRWPGQGLLPRSAPAPGQIQQQNHPHQHLLSIPLLLGLTALKRVTANMGEVKRYRLLLFNPVEPICQSP